MKPQLEARSARGVARARLVASCVASLVWIASCAPRPSSVPLGIGPLAIAEREARPTAAEAPRAPEVSPAATDDLELTDDKERASAENDGDADGDAADEIEAAESDDGSDEAGDSGGVAAFLGLYAGEDVAVFRLPGFPDREQVDPKAKIRIEAASGGAIGIVLVNSEDGSDLCEILARVEGDTALIESAQPCFTSEEGGMQAELSSGSAVLSGDRLTMEAEGTLSVSLGEHELEGDLSYSFEGTRQSR